MDENRVEDMARRAGMTPREYCLSRIAHWQSMLREVSDDYRGLDDEEFEELVEREVDGYTKNRSEKND
ncbi:hypothetical protein [Natrinema sp. 1APR25-10V2]|uniref:hypothetical protein n=1 Tax=Natrinema sp. 1APR25-10V2 TaxID=2951081 RepID=UPI002874FDA8|nr:hypothetical protein [Natrinema sp. 1APR25-10V2]MDS0474789.1 hypothetical protein [Natrinema sp. 1APR25-10V2]